MKNCDMLVVADALPLDVYEISAKQAAVCSYEMLDSLIMSTYCPTYQLASQSVKLEMGKTLNAKVV